jgi:hypothetical protein
LVFSDKFIVCREFVTSNAGYKPNWSNEKIHAAIAEVCEDL